MKLKHLESALERVRVFTSPRIEWEQYPTPPHLAAQILLAVHRYGDVANKAVGDLGVGCGVLSVAAALMGAAHCVGFDIDEAATRVARENFDAFDCHVDLVHVDVLSMSSRTSDVDSDAESGVEEVEAEVSAIAPRARSSARERRVTGGRGRGAVRSNRGRAADRVRGTRRTPPSAQRGADRDEEDDDDNDSDEESRGGDVPGVADPRQSLPILPLHSPTSSSSSSALFPSCVLDTVVLNPPFGTRQSGVDVAFLHVALQLARHAVYSLHKSSTRAFFHRLCERWGVRGEVVAEMQFELKRSYAFHREARRDVHVDLWRFTFIDDAHKPHRFARGGRRKAASET